MSDNIKLPPKDFEVVMKLVEFLANRDFGTFNVEMHTNTTTQERAVFVRITDSQRIEISKSEITISKE